MASSNPPSSDPLPSASGDPNSDLVASLVRISAKSPKLIRSSKYPAPADPSIELRSWKMNEFKYYDIPSPFPTLARGLFTTEVTQGDTSEKKYQIMVRGYDKFFNIGEVPWTTWLSLEEHTAPPYTLSLKSNGCIIFIAALTPSKLVITSKHSVGAVKGAEMSHAQAGEGWLKKYLSQKGKTEEDLASVLWEKNWTAIAELCDDSFEEHVLAYPPDKTGLHLHGLNVRSKDFDTMPTDIVDAFAEEWGFIKTPTTSFNSISEVRKFTDACAMSGKWNDEAVEGFVVRTTVTEPPTEGKGKNKEKVASSASPYKPGSSFFFKVKFDEPYMMYRDWREVTKTLLTAKKDLSPARVPKSKMRRSETRLYVNWVIEEIKKDRNSFDGFTKGRGIVATRNRFLEWMKTENGKKGLVEASSEVTQEVVKGDYKKTIILPVAIPGCGKTAVAVALAHIFGFGHTQSDDVLAKKPAPVFIKNVMNLLKDNDVVIADKNNHLKQHRQALRDATSKLSEPVRLLALNWGSVHSLPHATVHRICADRVQDRGENHQTLRPKSTPHEEVIWMFMNTSEELAPAEVDDVVEMDLQEDLEAAVRRAVRGISQILGLDDEPDDEVIREAIDIVKGYAPSVKKPDEDSGKKKATRYFGLLPEVDLTSLLDEKLAQQGVPEQIRSFWESLKKSKRVTARPHVTIVHSNNIQTSKPLWDSALAVSTSAGNPTFRGTLKTVLCDERIMALTLDDFAPVAEEGSRSEETNRFVNALKPDERARLHVTVGSMSQNVKAVEARGVVEKWRAGDRCTMHSFDLGDVVVEGRIKGLMT